MKIALRADAQLQFMAANISNGNWNWKWNWKTKLKNVLLAERLKIGPA